MDLFKSMDVSASGLNAQRGVLQAIATNLANANTTRTDDGGPYVRRQTVLSPTPVPSSSPFPQILVGKMNQEALGVKVEVQLDESRDPEIVYDPAHPDADDDGYVALPNVNIVEEMVNMMSAVRSYEANVTAFNAAKSMAMKSLEIGK
jgi:flagellar basal-body rod protein FlgC